MRSQPSMTSKSSHKFLVLCLRDVTLLLSIKEKALRCVQEVKSLIKGARQHPSSLPPPEFRRVRLKLEFYLSFLFFHWDAAVSVCLRLEALYANLQTHDTVANFIRKGGSECNSTFLDQNEGSRDNSLIVTAAQKEISKPKEELICETRKDEEHGT